MGNLCFKGGDLISIMMCADNPLHKAIYRVLQKTSKEAGKGRHSLSTRHYCSVTSKDETDLRTLKPQSFLHPPVFYEVLSSHLYMSLCIIRAEPFFHQSNEGKRLSRLNLLCLYRIWMQYARYQALHVLIIISYLHQDPLKVNTSSFILHLNLLVRLNWRVFVFLVRFDIV